MKGNWWGQGGVKKSNDDEETSLESGIHTPPATPDLSKIIWLEIVICVKVPQELY